MSEELTYDADSQLMRVRVWGYDSISDMQAQRLEVIKLHEAHGVSSLLVDVREQKSSAPLFDIFDFGDTWPTGIRVALLVSTTTPDDVLFLETVAMQRGKKIRAFFSEEESLAWLNGG
jgi:hypothetical protein